MNEGRKERLVKTGSNKDYYLSRELARIMKCKGKKAVSLKIRVSDSFSLEMHVDVDEANALNLSNGDFVVIKK